MVPCYRGGLREAHGEAPEEEAAFILLDACVGVEFQEQPAKILFEWRGTEHEHFPDILVLARSIKEFWECKKDHESLDLVVRRRTERLTELLAPLGFGYRLVTTSQLTQKYLLNNAISMRRRASSKVPDYVDRRIAKLGFDASIQAARLLGSNSRDSADHLSLLYACLYQGVLTGNLWKPISIGMDVKRSSSNTVQPWVWQIFDRIN
ncbi:MAG: hypothetical protein E6K53_09930 [Gammaproteobacteria bacterium]|nr:MAG: hypothetical protein E6K53_09930 [Gammaproteobacteria bacterium]